ncbi:hypothetical protein JQ581_28425 [Bradyrhizobium liaoningense]|uniref:hypothetical protein n=1 Tax=Bradyrhizobium liaoningense TaxID=43992 RepID=UPI001BA4B712|nr:hypothetical protein [Bradyrhizobium liaoningense]MBR0740868.1 hypothetical protein [Bradyrhizobium liaoningense]
MTRLIACAVLFVGLHSSLASGQSLEVFCQYDDTLGLVKCLRAGDPSPVFQYDLPPLDGGMLIGLADKNTSRLDVENCRKLTEKFRNSELEEKLNNSLEKLRAAAEDVRAAAPDNLALYKQLMFVYDGLFGRYKNGLQSYQTSLRSCRITPYPVRPDRA